MTAGSFLIGSAAVAWPPPAPPGYSQAQNDFKSLHQADGAVVQDGQTTTVTNPDGSTTTTHWILYNDGTCVTTTTTTYPDGS